MKRAKDSEASPIILSWLWFCFQVYTFCSPCIDINCSNGLQWNPRYLGIKQLRCEQVVPNYVESCQLAELGECNSHNRPIRDICPGDLLVYLVIPIPFDLQCQAFSFVLWDIIIYIYFMSDQISINSCQSMVTTEVNLIISLGIRTIFCTRYLN